MAVSKPNRFRKSIRTCNLAGGLATSAYLPGIQTGPYLYDYYQQKDIFNEVARIACFSTRLELGELDTD